MGGGSGQGHQTTALPAKMAAAMRIAPAQPSTDWREIVLLDTFNMERAGAALALNQGQNRILVAMRALKTKGLIPSRQSNTDSR